MDPFTLGGQNWIPQTVTLGSVSLLCVQAVGRTLSRKKRNAPAPGARTGQMTRRLWLKRLVVGAGAGSPPRRSVSVAESARPEAGPGRPRPRRPRRPGFVAAEVDVLLAFGEVLVEGRTCPRPSEATSSVTSKSRRETRPARPLSESGGPARPAGGGANRVLGIGERVALVSPPSPRGARHPGGRGGRPPRPHGAVRAGEGRARPDRRLLALTRGWAAVGYGIWSLRDSPATLARALMDAEVCVVGAGAAGGIMAPELAPRGVEVAVLESGPRHDFAQRGSTCGGTSGARTRGAAGSRDQDRHTVGGRLAYGLEGRRARGVGGSTLHWGAIPCGSTPATSGSDRSTGSRTTGRSPTTISSHTTPRRGALGVAGDAR